MSLRSCGREDRDVKSQCRRGVLSRGRQGDGTKGRAAGVSLWVRGGGSQSAGGGACGVRERAARTDFGVGGTVTGGETRPDHGNDDGRGEWLGEGAKGGAAECEPERKRAGSDRRGGKDGQGLESPGERRDPSPGGGQSWSSRPFWSEGRVSLKVDELLPNS